MEYVGIDVHKNQSQICLLTEAGEVLHQRILIEASTASEWVAQCLEALGHEVVVAAPNYAPMYAPRSRRVKTDRHDAEAVAHACRLGAYHPAHRTSARQRRPGGTRTTTPTRAESPPSCLAL